MPQIWLVNSTRGKAVTLAVPIGSNLMLKTHYKFVICKVAPTEIEPIVLYLPVFYLNALNISLL
ncbi:MAG: hypothetical protein ACI9IP_002471 [Arcticibacterium sp.]|jgi:hypothetical protein